ncbi:DinB family protein [bacterium]|nr:DinB family protein [bacterium]
MNWTALLNAEVEDNYRAADGLMAMVGDADLGWKPASGRNWMTTGQLLMHLTNACGFCCRGFLTGDWGMPEGDCEGAPDQEMPMEAMLPPAEALPTIGSVAEARRLLAEDKQLALAMIREAGEAKLDSLLVAAPWAPRDQQPLGRQFLSMTCHLQSHKSQLFYYLKLMGRDVNTMHLWGMN